MRKIKVIKAWRAKNKTFLEPRRGERWTNRTGKTTACVNTISISPLSSSCSSCRLQIAAIYIFQLALTKFCAYYMYETILYRQLTRTKELCRGPRGQSNYHQQRATGDSRLWAIIIAHHASLLNQFEIRYKSTGACTHVYTEFSRSCLQIWAQVILAQARKCHTGDKIGKQ